MRESGRVYQLHCTDEETEASGSSPQGWRLVRGRAGGLLVQVSCLAPLWPRAPSTVRLGTLSRPPGVPRQRLLGSETSQPSGERTMFSSAVEENTVNFFKVTQALNR